MKQKGRQTTIYLHTDCSPSLNMIWVSDIQKLFNRMKITNTNIQIISLSFAKKQSGIPIFLLKYKDYTMPKPPQDYLQTCISTIMLCKAKLINMQRQNLILKKVTNTV